jgi:LAO/AO transport system kinase
MQELVARVVRGETPAAARLARLVDDRAPGHEALLAELFPHTGKAWLIGVTGNPGAGKSSLVDKLVARFRSSSLKVGVVAVDPSSPFTQGAILGDRIRMQTHFGDHGVFIRSVATRGALGGLSRSALDIARVLDGWGARVVLIETVGVGQDEVDVTHVAHTSLVVTAPGLGDDIQAIKAGILECADVLAVNKADRDGADATVRDLEAMLALKADVADATPGRHGVRPRLPLVKGQDWVPPVLKCSATLGVGIDELMLALHRHQRWLESDEGRQRAILRVQYELLTRLRDDLVSAALSRLSAGLESAAAQVLSGALDPYSAAENLSRQLAPA